MKKTLCAVALSTAVALTCLQENLHAHCQMPCGVYHDDMVFSQIDQYIETMYKGVTVINDSKFANPHDRNETIRWVMLKDNASDEVASLITEYFLQQKIKPGTDESTLKKITSAHKLLFLLVAIKQNVDRQIVLSFSEEWDKFKSLFHIEGYACEMEKLKLQKHDHDHDHDHDHSPQSH